MDGLLEENQVQWTVQRKVCWSYMEFNGQVNGRTFGGKWSSTDGLTDRLFGLNAIQPQVNGRSTDRLLEQNEAQRTDYWR
jgi:hypothetical protein